MRNTKSFSKMQNSTNFHINADVSRKENQILMEASAKYDRYKKSASLPSYYLNKTRLKKITEIYRTLSSEKLRHSSKSRLSQALTPPRQTLPFTKLNLNSIDNNKQKNKLTLQRGENAQSSHNSNSAWTQLLSQLRSLTHKFQEILGITSEEAFTTELDKIIEEIKHKRKSEEVGKCLKTLAECLSRRQKIKVSETRKQFSNLSTDLSNLQVQLKKKAIRNLLDQKEIERQQNSNKDLQGQLTQLRKQLFKETKEIGCATEHINQFSNNQNESLIFANTQILTLTAEGHVRAACTCRCKQKLQAKTIKLAQCMSRLQKNSKRQKELLSVLVVLRGQGVDVERIYDDVINGRIEVPQNQENSILQAVSQAKRRERKQQKQAVAAVETSSEFDADNSLISSADGLSINYGQLGMEDYAFTIRRQYKCKKQMDPILKEKLKLNFDLLYEQQLYEDDYESEDLSSNPPTI